MKLSKQDMASYMEYIKEIGYQFPNEIKARKKKRFNRTPRKNTARCHNTAKLA
jgi:hypothetical protein